jgi:hypothetical protein
VPDFPPNIQMEWLVISGAPWLFAGAVVAVGSGLWLFIALIYRRNIATKNSTIESQKAELKSQTASSKVEIAGLNGANAILEQHLRLATKESEIAGRAKDEVERQLQTLREEVASLKIKAENASLARVEAQLQRVETAVLDLAAANNAVSSTLSATLKVTEAPDVASFTINTTQLDVIRDLDGWGALRKADPETLERIKDLGNPFPGISTKKK